MKPIGEQIKELRERKGWTLNQFAAEAGMNTPSVVGKWEQGENTPSKHSLVLLYKRFREELEFEEVPSRFTMWRVENGYSGRDIVRKADISNDTITRLERGKPVYPFIAEKVCDALDASPEELGINTDAIKQGLNNIKGKPLPKANKERKAERERVLKAFLSLYLTAERKIDEGTFNPPEYWHGKVETKGDMLNMFFHLWYQWATDCRKKYGEIVMEQIDEFCKSVGI